MRSDGLIALCPYQIAHKRGKSSKSTHYPAVGPTAYVPPQQKAPLKNEGPPVDDGCDGDDWPLSQLSQTSIDTDTTHSTNTTDPPTNATTPSKCMTYPLEPRSPRSSHAPPHRHSMSTPEIPPYSADFEPGKENIVNMAPRDKTGSVAPFRSASSSGVKDRPKVPSPNENRLAASASAASLQSSGCVSVDSNTSSPRVKRKKRKRGECQHGSETEPEESPPETEDCEESAPTTEESLTEQSPTERPGPPLDAPSDSSFSFDATLNAASSSSNDAMVVFCASNALGRP